MQNRKSYRRVLAFSFLLLATFLFAIASPALASHKGGPNEPARCLGQEGRGIFQFFSGACDAGLNEVIGCSGGDCGCSTSRCKVPPPPPVISHCGRDGERACCITEPRFANGIDSGCEQGYVEMIGCKGNCRCGGTNPLGFHSTSNCRVCGQKGARACGGVVGLGGSCDEGLAEIFGICTSCGQKGQIVCDGWYCEPGYRAILGFCSEVEQIAEPDCDCTPVPVGLNDDGTVPGYADLHAHIFSNEGFGGLVLWGDAFHPLGINEALRRDDYAYQIDVVNMHGNHVSPFGFEGKPVHGVGGILDLVGLGTSPLKGLDVIPHDHDLGGHGAPNFKGWPKWHTTTHQQMYYRWLERAYKGGLRLTVMLAVSNEALCKGSKRKKGRTCNDMEAIDYQIQAAYNLQAFVDAEKGGAGQGMVPHR